MSCPNQRFFCLHLYCFTFPDIILKQNKAIKQNIDCFICVIIALMWENIAVGCRKLLLFALVFPCLLSVAQIGLRQGAAAVDDNGLSGHEAGFVAGQIADQESDVFRLPKTADRQAGC